MSYKRQRVMTEATPPPTSSATPPPMLFGQGAGGPHSLTSVDGAIPLASSTDPPLTSALDLAQV